MTTTTTTTETKAKYLQGLAAVGPLCADCPGGPRDHLPAGALEIRGGALEFATQVEHLRRVIETWTFLTEFSKRSMCGHTSQIMLQNCWPWTLPIYAPYDGFLHYCHLECNTNSIAKSLPSLNLRQRDRAAWLMEAGDPLLERVTENLLDRLDDCRRTFPTALNLGGASHQVHRLIGGRGGVEKMITVDLSKDMIEKSAELRATEENGDVSGRIEDMYVVADEEFPPFGEGCFDVVLSSLGLHWVNDLPGAMTQCRLALKQDGLFLGAMLGGETLKELRIACTLAQLEREGGISPRISPLAQVRDAGNLLQRAGLALPTVDVDEFTVRYPCALDLIHHLRTMGEVNAVRERNLTLKKDTALATAAVYESMFGDADGTIPATFQVIYMTGWRPAPSQPIPKRRGSASASFQDLQKAFTPAEDGTPKSGTQ